MKDDKSKLIALILVIITIIVVVLSVIFIKDEDSKQNKVNIVTNYTKFYTVNSCLSRYISYLASNNADNLLLVLSDNYKKENNVTSQNVIEILGTIDKNANFNSKKMYYEELKNNVEKYYVYGQLGINQLYDDEILGKSNYKDVYYIVYMDFENQLFSIEPYSGDVFLGGENNE